MRLLLLAFAAVILQAQATLDLAPAQPRVDALTTFTLGGVTPASATWDFGDASQPQAGGAVATHTFQQAGTYLVRCTYTLATGAASSVQRSVRVVEPRRIAFAPALPEPGQRVTFRAQQFFAGDGVSWTFEDGVQAMGPEVSRTFAQPGLVRVTAADRGATGAPRLFRAEVRVGHQGPGAPFALSYLALRWEDGTVYQTVGQGQQGLMAYADLKHEGTGLLQAQWLVDGVPFRTFTRSLAFAGRATLASGQDSAGSPPLGLPTDRPGEHRVTLRILSPSLAFEVPILRYFVRLGGEAQGPFLRAVMPTRLRAGEEVELRLAGERFTQDMVLELGPDLAAVAPLQVLSTQTATTRVFVAPSVRPGSRVVRLSRPGHGPEGTARVVVTPVRRPRE